MSVGLRELTFHGQHRSGEDQHEEMIKQVPDIQKQKVALGVSHGKTISDAGRAVSRQSDKKHLK